MVNRFDIIKSMSLEELAAFLCTNATCGNCIADELCTRDQDNGYEIWLKEEPKFWEGSHLY